MDANLFKKMTEFQLFRFHDAIKAHTLGMRHDFKTGFFAGMTEEAFKIIDDENLKDTKACEREILTRISSEKFNEWLSYNKLFISELSHESFNQLLALEEKSEETDELENFLDQNGYERDLFAKTNQQTNIKI